MRTKIICFECQQYSHRDKSGACYRCHSGDIADVGLAFRPPKKIATSAWKELKELFSLQKARVESRGETMTYFIGFRTNSFRHRCQTKSGIPTKTKELATLESLWKMEGIK